MPDPDQKCPRWTATPHFEVYVNKPFAGTYVPLHHFRTNWAVVSFMVDIRRDVCLDDGLQPIESGATALNSALAELIDAEGNQRARKTCTDADGLHAQ